MPQPDASCVLVIGGGGREHALAWALARSPQCEKVFVAPGNGGTASDDRFENVAVADGDVDGLLALAQHRGAGLTIVGPEKPLALGIVDRFRDAGLTVLGPTRAAARLETSKVWAREFMERHGIPHPAFEICEDVDAAEAAAQTLEGECVVKADGLAAGKGVYVCDDMHEARDAIRELMVDQRFGKAGARVLIEERLVGPELSMMAVCDGTEYRLLPPSQDHKRLLEGDRGPNTGGMGAYAPAPLGTPEVMDAACRTIVEPTLQGMAAEGAPFNGCLYCGLMHTATGLRVIEYNVRFGDPETQAQLPLVRSDLHQLLLAAAAGRLEEASLELETNQHTVCVVLASRGYPDRAQTGFEIHGLERAAGRSGLLLFHAGTRRRDDGTILSSGGRVLNVVSQRDSLQSAVTGAYGVIGAAGVHFEGMAYRTDIAFRALSGALQ